MGDNHIQIIFDNKNNKEMVKKKENIYIYTYYMINKDYIL